MISIVENRDCMAAMAGFPDKFFDLAVVDPPYGIGEDGGKSNGRRCKSDKWKNPKLSIYKKGGWDKVPMNEDYFKELQRISENQIIWGANHFISKIPFDSPCWIIWDKKDGKDDSDFADCELAWTSFSSSVRMFRMHWLGWGAINAGEKRLHPTQKPTKLYSWIYKNYLPNGGKVLDTHLGSGSNRIAADKAGNIDFWGYELDKDYYEAQEKRWADFKKQLNLFRA